MNDTLIKEQRANEGIVKEVGCFEHKYKCLNCGLHFSALSWSQEWPLNQTTEYINTGKTSGNVFCPECGTATNKLFLNKTGRTTPIFATHSK